ncbi:MAG: response regulator [Burkholderiales bacterium]
MDRTLLLVDDEPNIITSLTRLLRRDGYRIISATSGEEGLALLKQFPGTGVIISDQRMPGMTGVVFLSQVKELFPDTVRIVLSGYTELVSVTDAINRGAIYKFLTKPWDDDLLRANVEEAFRRYEIVRENERLSEELKAVNTALIIANRKLEQNIEAKTDQLTRNLDVLSVSQEILERLPIAVMGVGEDGIIAIANAQARTLFGDGDLLLGARASDRLAIDTLSCLATDTGVSPDSAASYRLASGETVHYWCYPLGRYSQAKGRLLVIAV